MMGTSLRATVQLICIGTEGRVVQRLKIVNMPHASAGALLHIKAWQDAANRMMWWELRRQEVGVGRLPQRPGQRQPVQDLQLNYCIAHGTRRLPPLPACINHHTV